MTAYDINSVDRLIHNANETISKSQWLLQEIIDEADDAEGASGNTAGILQLLLQYRLDTQDALVALLQLEHHLLEVLGIGPAHSAQINIERMQYALGKNDLIHILHALNQLVQSLLVVARRYQNNQQKSAKSLSPHPELYPQQNKRIDRLTLAITHQKQFKTLILELSGTLEQLEPALAIGPMLDHISALHGPISRFYQAILNGLKYSFALYEKINKEAQLENTLEILLQQTHLVLQQMPALCQPRPFFTPKTETEEQLEKRASIKRMSNVFRY